MAISKTKVITGVNTRLSYFHGWEPTSINNGPERYSVSVLIPTVSLPLDKVMVGNLTRLLEVKGQLIKKALGISELPIEVGEDTISFP